MHQHKYTHPSHSFPASPDTSMENNIYSQTAQISSSCGRNSHRVTTTTTLSTSPQPIFGKSFQFIHQTHISFITCSCHFDGCGTTSGILIYVLCSTVIQIHQLLWRTELTSCLVLQTSLLTISKVFEYPPF